LYDICGDLWRQNAENGPFFIIWEVVFGVWATLFLAPAKEIKARPTVWDNFHRNNNKYMNK